MKPIQSIFGILLFSAAIGHAATLFQIGSQTVGANTAGTNTWPVSGSENPGNAVDSNTTNKYLNFGRTNTGYIITSSTAVIATGIFMARGNDSPQRDPLTFSVYGSNTASVPAVPAVPTPGITYDYLNPAIFTPIVVDASTNLQAVTAANGSPATQPSFANTTAYITYLVIFPTIRDAANTNSMQVAEARLTTATGSVTGTIAGGQAVEIIPEPTTVGLLGVSALGLLRRPRTA